MFVADPSKKPSDIYLYMLHPVRLAMLTEGATDAEKALAAQHWMYAVDLLKKGVIIFAGRTLDTTADSFAALTMTEASSRSTYRIVVPAQVLAR